MVQGLGDRRKVLGDRGGTAARLCAEGAGVRVQGCLAHKKTPTPLGPP